MNSVLKFNLQKQCSFFLTKSKQKSHFYVDISVLTKEGYLSLGSGYTSNPNALYQTLKMCNQVSKVYVQIH